VQLAFGSAIAAVLVVAAMAYRGAIVSTERGQWVQHTHDVTDNLQALLDMAQGIQASHRSFALTGEDSYLEQDDAVRSNAGRATAMLRELTLDNPEQQHRLATLERLVAQVTQVAAAVADVRRASGLEAAAESIRAGTGRRLMDDVRGVVREMNGEEMRLLGLRGADADGKLAQTKVIVILGTVLALLLAGAAGWSARRDGSRRASAEESLHRSEEEYRALILGVKDYAIVMLGPRGNIISWNAGAERMTGVLAADIIGQSFATFFLPDDIERGRPERILRMAATNGVEEQQGMRVRRDGSRFLVRTTFTALRDSAGDVRGFSVISRDLTDSTESGAKYLGLLEAAPDAMAIRDISVRKAAETHLAQMEGRYRGLLEAAPDAMVVVNQDGEIVLLNVQAEKQFGYSRDELLGKKVKALIPEGFAERLVADGLRSAEEALAQQIGTGIELTGRRKDESEFPIELMLSPLESAEGVLVTAAIRDITTRREAEANLLKKMDELNRSNEELAQFAYVASHDLQEPLRMVASYTQLLARRYKGKLGTDADEFIGFAVDGASRMQVLIKDLLTYSRVGTKGKELLDTSSEEALEQTLHNLRGAIEDSGALVTHDPLPDVLADEGQLVQLLQNLVGNAIKYQGPGVPLVHVSAAKDGDRKWLFSVKDNGLGIEPQYFEKIFGMFQRLHGREEFAGTGIGLAICKKIVERHGGNISVESQPGRGSTFSFALTGSEMTS
jgi:PAS domain S-box-containing protein